MDNQVLQPDLFSFGVTGASLSADDITLLSEVRPVVSPAGLTKLPEGWHNTEKYGEVYVSPGGIAWTVQRNGDRLDSVAVKITKEDIIQKSSAERVKIARRLKEWRNKSRGGITKRSNLAVSGVGDMN